MQEHLVITHKSDLSVEKAGNHQGNVNSVRFLTQFALIKTDYANTKSVGWWIDTPPPKLLYYSGERSPERSL